MAKAKDKPKPKRKTVLRKAPAPTPQAPSLTPEAKLASDIASFAYDPLSFVMYAYPWGKAGTFLEGHLGPDKWQKSALVEIGERMRAASATGEPVRILRRSGHEIGKGEPVDIIIDSPDGPRRWGDLKIGDYVFGRDGNPTMVAGVYPLGIVPTFRVFLDDGSSIVTTGDHLWSVRGRHERRNKLASWRTCTTKELMQEARRSNGLNVARQFELPRIDPVQFPEKETPIQPYTLGTWLGNGCNGIVHTPYTDICAHLMEIGEDCHSNEGGRGCFSFGVMGLKVKLRSIGLLGLHSPEKYVPEIFKYNSVHVRAEVLRGLLDTDGTAEKNGNISFSTSSPQLSQDVMWLVRSLGGVASLRKGKQSPQYTYKGEKLTGLPSYQVGIAFPDGFKCFYVSSKQERVPTHTNTRQLKRWVDHVEEDGSADCMCIRVAAEDSLYLANDFIPTHNTAFISWIINWWNSTRDHPAGVVTANTKQQLEFKTWRELAKWHDLMIHKDWFTWTSTKFFLTAHPGTWFTSAIPWTKERSEAFAGTHEKRGVLMIFDEASLIDDRIWDVADGSMDVGSLWLAFGNPTRNVGKFFEAAVGRMRHRWFSERIDSRESTIANQARIKQWIEDYGEDSDYCRVRVKGEFPRASTMQFIPSDIVMEAAQRHMRPDAYEFAPRIIGVDVARFGDDMSTIIKRQGLHAHDLMKFRNIDLMRFSGVLIQQIEIYKPDAVFIDATGGYGAAVVDRLRQLGIPCIEVQFGGAAAEDRKYNNKRTEIWGRMKDWLKLGGAIPDDDELKADLVGPEYSFDNKDRVALESKDDMKRDRALPSPDCADSLACSFAEPVVRQDDRELSSFIGVRPAVGSGKPGEKGYDPTAFIRSVRRKMEGGSRNGEGR